MKAPAPTTLTPTELGVLRALEAHDGFVSGEELGAALGVTRAAVAKAVAELRALGYVLESSTRRGHRLAGRTELLVPWEVAAGLETAHFGQVSHHYREAASTQAIARSLAEDGAPHGTLVVAEAQTAGRGRLGRAYACPPGGSWTTVIVRKPFSPSLGPLVSLAAGVAVADAVTAVLPGAAVMLKWPNDVLIAGRKVAGTLTEMVAEEQAVHYLLAGTGINANFPASELPADVHERATTLRDVAGHDIDRLALLRRYLVRFEQLCEAVAAGDGAEVLRQWRAWPNTLGQRVAVSLPGREFEATAEELDDSGALLVATATGERLRIAAADVVHLSPR
ncbi:MAG: biotin--[acetyl-CoA-carboxylase] ligase [Dehalococcoidia bacterium]|nr:biotin--[acetyl-CoA-carboxylase] ligase [Dehalococcoidia bacterium]